MQTKKTKPDATVHTHFEIYIMRPICLIRKGVKLIKQTPDGDNNGQNKEPFGLSNGMNVSHHVSKAFISHLFVKAYIRRVCIWEIAIQLQRIATDPMPPTFLPCTQSRITLTPITNCLCVPVRMPANLRASRWSRKASLYHTTENGGSSRLSQRATQLSVIGGVYMERETDL